MTETLTGVRPLSAGELPAANPNWPENDPDQIGVPPGSQEAVLNGGAESQPDKFDNPANPAETQDSQAERTAAEARDAEARYTDADLLGKSFRVRRTVQEAGTQAIKGWQGLKAKVRNTTTAALGKGWKWLAHKRAKKSYERKNARLQEATSERLKALRQPRVDKAKERMDRRADKLQEHIGRMEARTKAVHENADRRRREYIDELKGRRENALARKAVRKQLRSEGASRRETRAIVNEQLSAEQLQRVGKVAIVAETSRRKLTEAGRDEKRAKKRHDKTERRITTTDERAQNHDKSVEAADIKANEINSRFLPEARQRAAQLRAELDAAEPDSPVHDVLLAELQKSEQNIMDLEWQITHLGNAAEYGRQESAKSKVRLGELHSKKADQARAVEQASRHAGRRNQNNNVHQGQLQQEVTVALNPNSGTGKET